MREPAEVRPFPFPRPGPVLKAVLITLTAVSLLSAILRYWLPGPPLGARILGQVLFDPALFLAQPWRVWSLVTSGVLTDGTRHILFTLVGLYFLSPDLERRWGGARFLRFLLASVVAGNLFVLGFNLLPLPQQIFHHEICFGAGAAITATAIAWSLENAGAQVRLFFVLPVSGRLLFWVTIGFCVLGVVYHEDIPEGAMALFGGAAVGMGLSRSPSPLRAAWLRTKLFFLRRGGSAVALESLPGFERKSRRGARGSQGGPALRVVQGGLDDDLKNRKPPKDKRYLN